jgi:predicted 2-oxoglutarate/Fe(II)-dependent dioxygenase YbiX
MFQFSSLGGRLLVLSFLKSFSQSESAKIFRDLMSGAKRFGTFTTALLLVTSDSQNEGLSVPESIEGVRYFFDIDREIFKLFAGSSAIEFEQPATYIIDERLRVIAIIRTRDASIHAAQVYAIFDRLRAIASASSAQNQAPVLMVPHVFEPQLCEALIAGFHAHGGKDSGFMVEQNGFTVPKFDYKQKRRHDWTLDDENLIKACHRRIERRVKPEIARAFQFNANRIERNVVACYEAKDGGHFNRHRDNTTKATSHRRFAVSLNLNTDEYDGGDLVFPEFGLTRFRPPTGGACVFSCSLLHEATAVSRGNRYVFVPFLYDDAAAAIRQDNQKYLVD